MVIFEEDIMAFLGGAEARKINKQKIIGVALKYFFEDEKERMMAMEEEFGALSIRSSITSTSYSSELVRFLPHSRLREANPELGSPIGGGGLSRSNSVRSTLSRDGGGKSAMEQLDEDDSPIGFDSNESAASSLPSNVTLRPADRPASLRRRLKEVLRYNPFHLAETFSQVNDPKLAKTLLAMEQSLEPTEHRIDVVIPDGASENDANQAFYSLLGTPLEKHSVASKRYSLFRNGRVPSSVIESTNLTVDDLSIGVTFALASESEETLMPFRKRAIEEFIQTEERFLEGLQFLCDHFTQGSSSPSSAAASVMLDQSIRKECDFIFEDYKRIWSLHQKLYTSLEITDRDQWIQEQATSNGASLATALSTWFRSMETSIYSDYFTNSSTSQDRLNQLLKRPPFAVHFEDVRRKALSRFNADIASLMASPLQRITRYSNLLAALLKTIQQPNAEAILRTNALVKEITSYLNEVEKGCGQKAKQVEVVAKIMNCPPSFLSFNQIYWGSATVYAVHKEEVNYSSKYVLHLFKDCLLVARNLTSSSGTFKEKKESSKFESEFLFYCPIDGVNIKSMSLNVRTKTGGSSKTCKPFLITLPPSSTLTLQPGQQMITFEQLHEQSHPKANELAPNQLMVVAAKMEEFRLLTEQVAKFKQEALIASSPARIFHQKHQARGKDLYFYVYPQSTYAQQKHHNSTAVVLVNDCNLPDLSEMFNGDNISEDGQGTVNTVMMLQCLKGDAFRMTIKSRELIIATVEGFSPQDAFLKAPQITPSFLNALLNADLMNSIYPPFTQQTLHLQRHHLEQTIQPFCNGLSRKLRDLFLGTPKSLAKMSSPTSSSSFSPSPSDVEYSEITPMPNTTKKSSSSSLMGKMFGKLKSPLSPTSNTTNNSSTTGSVTTSSAPSQLHTIFEYSMD